MALPYTLPETPVIQFDSIQEASEATHMDRHFAAFVDDIPVDIVAYSGRHNVNTRIAVATIEVELPRVEMIKPNAKVEVQAGWNNLVSTEFHGRIPSWEFGLDRRGDILSVDVVGWSSLLDYPERFELEFEGPIPIKDLFLYLCQRRNVPMFQADEVTDHTGQVVITLGGNPFHEDGVVRIPGSTSPLAFLNNAANEFGYRVFDEPSGTVRLRRISGKPSEEPAIAFIEGENIFDGRRLYDISTKVNYWDFHGIEYENDIGENIPIRAIPTTVISDPDIPVNDGVNYRRHRSSLFVTQQMAEIARNIREIDTSEATEPVAWESHGLPFLKIGDTVEVHSETLEADDIHWLTSKDTTISNRGYTARYTAESGAGEPMPHAVDLVQIQLQDNPRHIGDEHVPWYAVPNPEPKRQIKNHQGEWVWVPMISWEFEIPNRATHINVVGLAHGSNSQFIGGKNEDLTISRFEIWRDPINDDRAESSGSLPILDENYAQRLPYNPALFPRMYKGQWITNPYHFWSPFAIPLRGTDAGTVTLRLLSGENRKLAEHVKWDDFEVAKVRVDVYGTVEPIVVTAKEVA